MLPIHPLKQDLIKIVGLLGPHLFLEEGLVTMHLTRIRKVGLIHCKVVVTSLLKVLQIKRYLLISILLLILLV